MIRAVVLAAGESRRMGMPKPLLPFGETTFLEQIVGVLRRSDAGGITVVLGAQAELVRASTDLSGVDVVVNEDYRAGQLSSLVAGLRSISDNAEAILLCLVDNPFITVDGVTQIVTAFRESRRPIVVPVFNRRRGHPTLFAASMFDELRNAPADQGARHVVNADRARVLELAVSDSSILARINTPEHYAAYFGMPPQIREER